MNTNSWKSSGPLVGPNVRPSGNHVPEADSAASRDPSIGRWAADQVAPSYWRPNADIINCHYCTKRFDTTDKIHHCRACGEGFCSTCSSNII